MDALILEITLIEQTIDPGHIGESSLKISIKTGRFHELDLGLSKVTTAIQLLPFSKEHPGLPLRGTAISFGYQCFGLFRHRLILFVGLNRSPGAPTR